MLRSTSTISKYTNIRDWMRISLTFPTISEEPSSNTMEFCCGNGMTMKKFVTVLWRQPCLIHVLQVDWKCLVDPMASCFMVNRIWPLFSTSESLYPNMKFRKRLIRAKQNFCEVSENHNVSPGVVDCSLYASRIALRYDCHKNQMCWCLTWLQCKLLLKTVITQN